MYVLSTIMVRHVVGLNDPAMLRALLVRVCALHRAQQRSHRCE